MSSRGVAHAASFQLYEFMEMQHPDGQIGNLSHSLQGLVKNLHLGQDIEVGVLVENGGPSIDLRGKTEFGRLVLDELKMRSDTPQCPDDMCEFSDKGECVWCGRPKG